MRGADTKGTYCLAEPDGTAHFHDKDEPSFWENNYYSAGQRRRARPHVGRPDRPGQRLRVRAGCGRQPAPGGQDPPAGRRHVLRLLPDLEADGAVAPEAGPGTDPAVRPGDAGADGPHAREWRRCTRPTWATTRWRPCSSRASNGRSRWSGETRICDRDGTTLGRLAYEDGEGYIAADVTLAAPAADRPGAGHLLELVVPRTPSTWSGIWATSTVRPSTGDEAAAAAPLAAVARHRPAEPGRAGP